MKPLLLLLLVCTAILATGARADTPKEPETLVKRLQEYVQKATAMVKSAFSMVQESEAAQQARRWLANNMDAAKQQFSRLKERLAELWKRPSTV